MASFTLQQTTAIVEVNKYQVVNTVILAVGADPNIYVFKTSTRRFSHYASAADVAQWPVDCDVASLTGAAYYRQPTVTRIWDTVRMMKADLAASLFRARSLASELTEQQASLVGTTTTTVTGS